MAVSLQVAFGKGAFVEGCYRSLLVVSHLAPCFSNKSNKFRQKFGKGLDGGNPFSDTTGVDVVLREAEKMHSLNMVDVGIKHAARIWGYMSKFVMLDRFSKTLGAAGVYPGPSMPRKRWSLDYFGTASRVSAIRQICPTFNYANFQILDELNPPTKLLGKFLRTWGDREKKISQYSTTAPAPPSVHKQDPADVALALSRRLIAVVKVKSILNIETGLEMIALAMAISSEVRIVAMLRLLKDSDLFLSIRIMEYFQKRHSISKMSLGGMVLYHIFRPIVECY